MTKNFYVTTPIYYVNGEERLKLIMLDDKILAGAKLY